MKNWQTMVVLLGTAGVVMAGGGPHRVLVVVNDASPESLELGQYYQDQRAIPERNICHVNTTTNYSIELTDFTNDIANVVRSYISSAGLSNQIDYVVFTRGMPYRVYSGTSSNGITAAMYYGFKTAPVCDSPSTTSAHDYFREERSFWRAASPVSNRYYLSMVLTGFNMDEARRAVDRSVQADHTQPTGTVYFLHTDDGSRTVQWRQFEDSAFLSRFLDIPQDRQILDANYVQDRTNIAGYAVGYADVQQLATCTFVPGAIGDHLTSYGGHLLDGVLGHMSDLHWIKRGCVATYGTLIEPCAYTNKFPAIRLHYWYGRGFNAGESYWMSVRNPYQGVFTGDPLCAPYAALPPTVSVAGLAAGQVVTGSTNLQLVGAARDAARPVDRIEVYLDGVLAGVATNLPPTPGNQVSITLNGTARTYTVAAGDDLFAVARGITAQVNNPPDIRFTAESAGDRVQVVQDARGVAGETNQYVAATSIGTAAEKTLFAWAPATNLLETAYPARQRVTLTGTPVSGDVLRAVVTNLNGQSITNEAIAGTGDSAQTVLQALANAVNADINLQDTAGVELKYVGTDEFGTLEGWFVARTNTWNSYNLYLVLRVINQPGSSLAGTYAGRFVSNTDVMSARGQVLLASGRTNLAAGYTLDTTGLADGPHSLEVVAYEGTAVRTQGRATIPFVVDNNAITCTVAQPGPNSNILLGRPVTTVVEAASGGTITQAALYVEGKLLAASNSAPCQFIWDSAAYGAGVIGVQALAHDDLGGAAWSGLRSVVVYSDDDADGVSDQWEYRYFGSATVYDGSADPDNDLVPNAAEYVADTVPTNAGSLLQIVSADWITNGPYLALGFLSSTIRQYRVYYNDESLAETAAWAGPSNALWGADGTSLWNDTGADLPPATNSARFYRVHVYRP